MLQLANWLFENGRNYQAGVDIFIKLEVDPDKNAYFTDKNPDQFKRNLLRRLLINFARINNVKPQKFVKVVSKAPGLQQKLKPSTASAPVVPVQSNLPASNKPKVIKNPHVDYSQLPPELQTLFDNNAKLYNNVKSLHVALKGLKDADDQIEKRADLCTQIIDLQAQIRTNWRTIDDWWVNKDKQQNTPKVPLMTDLEKDRRIKANKNYIRRYHGDKSKQAEVKKRMQELDNWGESYEKLIS